MVQSWRNKCRSEDRATGRAGGYNSSRRRMPCVEGKCCRGDGRRMLMSRTRQDHKEKIALEAGQAFNGS